MASTLQSGADFDFIVTFNAFYVATIAVRNVVFRDARGVCRIKLPRALTVTSIAEERKNVKSKITHVFKSK